MRLLQREESERMPRELLHALSEAYTGVYSEMSKENVLNIWSSEPNLEGLKVEPNKIELQRCYITHQEIKDHYLFSGQVKLLVSALSGIKDLLVRGERRRVLESSLENVINELHSASIQLNGMFKLHRLDSEKTFNNIWEEQLRIYNLDSESPNISLALALSNL